MHSIIMMSALAVTSGLFGGGRAACTSGQCGGSAMWSVQGHRSSYTPTAYASQPASSPYVPTAYYGTGYVYPATYSQPVGTAPPAAAQGMTTAAPSVATPSPFYYYAYPAVTRCPNGNCYRR
jgi:hypothetical protein